MVQKRQKGVHPIKIISISHQQHITLDKILNTNQIYNSIEIGNQHMETSHTIA